MVPMQDAVQQVYSLKDRAAAGDMMAHKTAGGWHIRHCMGNCMCRMRRPPGCMGFHRTHRTDLRIVSVALDTNGMVNTFRDTMECACSVELAPKLRHFLFASICVWVCSCNHKLPLLQAQCGAPLM